MAGGGGGEDGEIGFQIAPMIDLILVLMVFFMITVAKKQVENELGITLPGTAPSLKTGDPAKLPLNIGIEPDGSINLNNQPVADKNDNDLKGLKDKLKEQVELFGDKTPIVIAPNGDTPHKRVIDVLNACSASKAKNISFGG